MAKEFKKIDSFICRQRAIVLGSKVNNNNQISTFKLKKFNKEAKRLDKNNYICFPLKFQEDLLVL